MSLYNMVNDVKPAPIDLPDTNVGELISRQAALVAVKDALMAWSYMPKWRDEKILEAIAELPSAQPEIIRYRECKFASGDSRICMKFDHSPIGELDFCSFAERREVTT